MPFGNLDQPYADWMPWAFCYSIMINDQIYIIKNDVNFYLDIGFAFDSNVSHH